jgi:hypothetical protein
MCGDGGSNQRLDFIGIPHTPKSAGFDYLRDMIFSKIFIKIIKSHIFMLYKTLEMLS